MLRISTGIVAAIIAVWAVVSACAPTCSAESCAFGCCGGNGICYTGGASAYCGTNGVACVDCGSGTCDPGTNMCSGSENDAGNKHDSGPSCLTFDTNCQISSQCCSPNICVQALGGVCSTCLQPNSACTESSDCCNGFCDQNQGTCD